MMEHYHDGALFCYILGMQCTMGNKKSRGATSDTDLVLHAVPLCYTHSLSADLVLHIVIEC